jgi:hypothetical protein
MFNTLTSFTKKKVHSHVTVNLIKLLNLLFKKDLKQKLLNCY